MNRARLAHLALTLLAAGIAVFFATLAFRTAAVDDHTGALATIFSAISALAVVVAYLGWSTRP